MRVEGETMRCELKGDDLNRCLRRLPGGVREILLDFGDEVVVAGGFVRSVVAGEPVADRALELSGRLAGDWKVNYDVASSVHQSARAVTVRTVGSGVIPPVQFCYRWPFQDASDLLGQFDFTVCKAAFWYDGSRWCSLVDPTFYASVSEKRLRYCSPDRVEAPGDALLRVLKYYRRGYRIGLWDLGRVVARLSETGGGRGRRPRAGGPSPEGRPGI